MENNFNNTQKQSNNKTILIIVLIIFFIAFFPFSIFIAIFIFFYLKNPTNSKALWIVGNIINFKLSNYPEVQEAYEKLKRKEITNEEYMIIFNKHVSWFSNLWQNNIDNKLIENNNIQEIESNNINNFENTENEYNIKVEEESIIDKSEKKVENTSFSTWWSIFDNYTSVIDEFKK